MPRHFDFSLRTRNSAPIRNTLIADGSRIQNPSLLCGTRSAQLADGKHTNKEKYYVCDSREHEYCYRCDTFIF